MPALSPFWSAAVRLTARVDLSGIPDDLDPATLDAAQLVRFGVGPRHAQALVRGAPPIDAPRALRLTDAAYPDTLRRLPHAPPVLFWEGDLGVLGPTGVALVGSRRASGEGRRMARLLSGAVAGAGGIVVSGLAHGIDSEAHGAAGGRTIAVLGQGLSHALPGARQRLRQDICARGGLVLSELPPGRPASRATFPMRNRIIAGLAALTVVVEARLRSGARITARNALEAGREVMAVPAHPLRSGMEGCMLLIQEGAGVVTEVADVLLAAGLRAPTVAPVADPLLDAIGGGADFDTLQARTGMRAAGLLRALAERELAGQVERLPGGRYARCTR